MRINSVTSLICLAAITAGTRVFAAPSLLEAYKVRASCGEKAPVGSLYSIRSRILGEQSVFEGKDGKFVGKVTIQRTDDNVQCLLSGRMNYDEQALNVSVSHIACSGESPFSYSFNIPFRRLSKNELTYSNSSMDFCGNGVPLIMTLIKKPSRDRSQLAEGQ